MNSIIDPRDPDYCEICGGECIAGCEPLEPIKTAPGGTCLFLTIEDEKLVAGVITPGGGLIVVEEIKSVEDFNRLASANGGHMGVSSTVDFPEEYTRDPAVIALCRRLRS